MREWKFVILSVCNSKVSELDPCMAQYSRPGPARPGPAVNFWAQPGPHPPKFIRPGPFKPADVQARPGLLL